MLIVLPLLAWGLLLLAARVRAARQGSDPDWRVAFLHASLAWAVAVVVITEALSSVRLLTAGALAAAWAALCAALLAWLARGRYRGGWRPAPALPRDLWLLLGGAGLYAALIGLTALTAPPNNWDSFVYHLSRVMHWAQNRSVEFYPTHILAQLYYPPGAEYILLHLQLLAHGDQWANLVEWFAMIGSLAGVALIAERLGAGARGQVLAVVVCVTLPTGILFASNTKNDYVEAFWLVCLAYFVLDAARAQAARNGRGFVSKPPFHVTLSERSEQRVSAYKGEREILRRYAPQNDMASAVMKQALGIGAALGLALLTKAPAYLFAWPFAAWHGLAALRARRGAAVLPLAVVALAALALNANPYRRNWALFGWPLGPTSIEGSGPGYYANERLSPAALLVNIARNASLHMSTPSAAVNEALTRGFTGFAALLGQDVNDPRAIVGGGRIPFHIQQTNTFEDTTGNPWHFAAILVAGLLIAASRESWRRGNAARFIYAACVLAGALTLSVYLKWEIFGARLQVPLFVLGTPLVGWALERHAGPRWSTAAGLAFLALAGPWVLVNETRPLLPWRAFTAFDSILVTPRSQMYFYADPSIEEPYRAATALIAASGCRQVGLSIGAAETAEYLVWVLLGAGPAPPRIEHVDFEWDARNPSGNIPTDFAPCAYFHEWYDAGLVGKYTEAIHGAAFQFGRVYAVVPQ